MQKENNKKIIYGIVGVLVLVATFYGGMTYGGNNVRASINSRSGAPGQNGINNGMRGGRGGFTAGQIISKDANSITVQLMTGGPNSQGQGGSTPPTQGGSKIIFLDSNTKITKSIDGTSADLAVGTQVTVNGTPNTDGSENATNIQIRPTTPPVLK